MECRSHWDWPEPSDFAGDCAATARSPLVVLEDDVFWLMTGKCSLKELLHPGRRHGASGLESRLNVASRIQQQQEMISLFEPAYPSEKALQTIVNSNESRQSKRLRMPLACLATGLQPKMAEQLLKRIKRLETMPLNLGRGFPEILTNGIDGLLNLHYQQIKARSCNATPGTSSKQSTNIINKDGPNQFGNKRHLTETLHTIHLLGKEIANNSNYRTRAQLDIGRNAHTTLKIELLITRLNRLLFK